MNKFFLSSPVSQNYGMAVVRIITGILLIYHGLEMFDTVKMKMYAGWFTERNYENAAAWAYAGKAAELLAGIGFTLGLLTRLASLASIAVFTSIIFLLGDKGKIFEGDQHPFLFILLAPGFLFYRPGCVKSR